MCATPFLPCVSFDAVYGSRKLVLTTGVLLGMIQLTVLPRIIRFFGIVRWYRIGWVLTVGAFLVIPNAKKLSWNSPSLFATCVLGSLTIYCCSSAVRGIGK